MLKLLCGTAMILGLAACGAEQSRSGTMAARRDIAAAGPVRAWLPGIILTRVVAEAAQPGTDRRCQLAVTAEVAIEGSKFKGIVLSDAVSGPCEVMVSPNKRFYELTEGTDACGTRVYTGALESAPGASRITVRDNSASACGNKPAGALEVAERDAAGRLLQFAGDW